MRKSRRVLVVIWVLTHFKEMARLVRFLQRDTHWQPVVMLGYAPSAPDEAKEEWDRTGVPWFVLGERPPNLDTWACNGVQPETPAPAGALARHGEKLPFRTSVVNATGPGLESGRAPRGHKALQNALVNVCAFLLYPALFLTPSWVVRRRALKKCPETAPPAQAVWVAGRLLLKGQSQAMWIARCLRAMVPFFRVVIQMLTMARTLRRARVSFAQVKPDVIALAEDNAGYPTGIFVKAAREGGAGSVIIPYTLANTKEFVEGLGGDPAHSTRRPHNWLVAKLYPRWCHRQDGRGILRLPGHHVLAMEWLGIAPDRPWIPNDGHWDTFAVESPRMQHRYLNEFRVPRERLALTGAVSDDLLFAAKTEATAIKETVYKELKLPLKRPMALLAFPPNQFSLARSEWEFADYGDLIAFLIKSLRILSGFNVVVSLHPRIPESNRHLIESLGGKVSSWDTLQLVPACDLYIASVSATIRWAIACGIPVINYDLYKLRYNDYDSAAGVITMETRESFLTLLRQVNDDPAWLRDWAVRQRPCSADWGRLDGKSGWRIVEVFDRLAGQDKQVPH